MKLNKNNLAQFMVNEIRCDMIRYNIDNFGVFMLFDCILKKLNIKDIPICDTLEEVVETYLNLYLENRIKIKAFDFLKMLKECLQVLE